MRGVGFLPSTNPFSPAYLCLEIGGFPFASGLIDPSHDYVYNQCRVTRRNLSA